MSQHEKFKYKTLDELKQKVKELNVNIPFSDDISILKQPVNIGDKIVPNSMIVHPMEGCDGTEEGKPGELTYRRYKRFAEGGAGLLWVEACAVTKEGRANPRQLYICEETKQSLIDLKEQIIEVAKEKFGEDHKPYLVLQLTHSGRYSRPTGKAEPIIAVNNPYLDKYMPEKYHIITDEELEQLEDKYVKAAILAKEIGFDAVDIKSCHRYLSNELLSAFTREGKYGGSFENRTRFLLNIVDKIKARLGDSIEVTVRLNAYDSIPYPYGFGVDKNDVYKPDLSEPIKLVKILNNKGVKFINISCGNPYYNPHVGRPYDMGYYIPPQHPIEAAAKMLNIIKDIQQSVPDIKVIATGFTWFREFGANIAAGGIKEGWFKFAGFGRQAFAYPDFAKDIIQNGKMERNKCCITCSKCTGIMRDGGMTGCVPKDPEVYIPIYKKGREGKETIKGNNIAEHV